MQGGFFFPRVSVFLSCPKAVADTTPRLPSQISIRGKGAVKQGRGHSKEEDLDDIHVLITGSDVEALNKATAMVKEHLTPVADEANEHKKKQVPFGMFAVACVRV